MTILFIIIAVLAIFAFYINSRPDDFTMTRTAIMKASPSAVFEQVNDFHNWNSWSPWAKMDPNAKNTLAGPDSGIGAKFGWDGNSKVGAGSMEITESKPNELIVMRLEFIRPFKGVNTTRFTFTPESDQTLMTWTMTGKGNFMTKAMALLMNCDKMVSGQFDQGMASIKTIVEK